MKAKQEGSDGVSLDTMTDDSLELFDRIKAECKTDNQITFKVEFDEDLTAYGDIRFKRN